MTVEEWKDIINYKGYYQVSNLGRIKGLTRVDCRGRRLRERLLELTIDKKGYVCCSLSKERKNQTCKVHRLVGLHIILNTTKKSKILNEKSLFAN